MKRSASIMKLLPGNELLYQQRHDAIWPELIELLKASGISQYSIYLDITTSSLFAIMNSKEDELIKSLPDHPVMKKWWNFMKDIMETNEDGSPLSIPLKEVFYLP